jgi:hypothetical protein
VLPQNGWPHAPEPKVPDMQGSPLSARLAFFRLVVALSVLVAPRDGAGQVNVEGLRKSLTASGVHGTLSGSITTYGGNTVGTALGSTALIGYREQRQLVYLSTNANYSKVGGEVQVANAFVHFRYNYVLAPWIAWEAFAQIESDRFRRLRWRSLLGTGPRFTIFDGESVALFYGASYMFEHTKLSESVEDRPVRPPDVHRMNNYAALLLVLEPGRASVGNTIYFQPRLDDFRDVRLLDILSLDVTITGKLSASLQATVRYESPVPEPIKRADLMVKNLLGVTF